MIQRETMKILKKALTTISALMLLWYSEGANKIIFILDISLNGWGAHLNQLDADEKRHLLRFLSSLWSESKKKYDVNKREC